MCLGPLTAFYAAEKNSSGKRGLVFDHKLAFSGVPIKIACGQCLECRLAHSRQWAMRCMHEKRMHKVSSFLTLTYDPAHLPVDGSLSLDDLQRFMKRLRHHLGKGIRFYACGEYGDVDNRPHYHVLLFNREFEDKKFYKRGKRDGEVYYTSDILSRIWTDGFSIVGDVSFDSCAYVARYVTKKITGGKAADHYMGREPEFVVMSRKPGLGTAYYLKYAHEIYGLDSVVINGAEVRPPRFYDDLYKMLDPQGLSDIKKARKRRFLLSRRREDETSRRRLVKELCVKARLNLWRKTI